MIHYASDFDPPIRAVGITILYKGGLTKERQGIFVIHLKDTDGLLIAPTETGIPVSSLLDQNFCYVTQTDEDGHMRLSNIKTHRPFSSISLEYKPLFTNHPLEVSKFGPAFLVDLDSSANHSVETIVIRPTA